MKTNAANIAPHKIAWWEAKFRRQKMDEKKNKFRELSTKEIQQITDNTQYKGWNENITRYVFVTCKFPSKVPKFQNMNIEINFTHL